MLLKVAVIGIDQKNVVETEPLDQGVEARVQRRVGAVVVAVTAGIGKIDKRIGQIDQPFGR